MEALLKDIYAVVGVTGAFVCGRDGRVLAKLMPENSDAAQVELAARVVGQTFQALDTTGHSVEDVDLAYDKGRLLLKNLQGGVLAIVCRRNVNVPLLNLTASATVLKLAAELQSVTLQASTAVTDAQPSTVTGVPPVIAEMEQEIYRIVDAGKHYRLRLRAMGTIATWLVCPNYSALLKPPENKTIELCAFQNDGYTLELLSEQLGYRNNREYNQFFNNRRLNFTDPKRDLNILIYLDNLEMYHKLDLIPFLTQEELVLPVTALLLTRLQIVEMTEPTLREMCVLVLEHDLGVGSEKGKIDVSYMMRLCADDWGWFKTVSMNLDRLANFAAMRLEPSEREIVGERTRRLKRSMDTTPKSLRWLARARLGETARWYDTPQVYRPSATHPGMPIG